MSETKNPDEFVVEKTKELAYDSSFIVSPSGPAAGGLIILWNQSVKLNVISSSVNLQDTTIEYKGKRFYSSFIYADTDRHKRNLMWSGLLAENETREAPWFVTGDFNDLTNNSEKDGGPLRPEGSFSDLRTFFSEGDLFDIPHSGDPLSWRGQRGDHFVRCRLDRAVANTGWAERFPAAHSQYLPFEGSDHRPILTTLESESKKRRGIFRYDRRLKDNLEVKELVKKAWSQEENISVGEHIA